MKTSKAQRPAVADDLSLFTVTPRLSWGDGLGRRGRASHAEASDYAPPDKDRISSPPVSNDYRGCNWNADVWFWVNTRIQIDLESLIPSFLKYTSAHSSKYIVFLYLGWNSNWVAYTFNREKKTIISLGKLILVSGQHLN